MQDIGYCVQPPTKWLWSTGSYWVLETSLTADDWQKILSIHWPERMRRAILQLREKNEEGLTLRELGVTYYETINRRFLQNGLNYRFISPPPARRGVVNKRLFKLYCVKSKGR